MWQKKDFINILCCLELSYSLTPLFNIFYQREKQKPDDILQQLKKNKKCVVIREDIESLWGNYRGQRLSIIDYKIFIFLSKRLYEVINASFKYFVRN